MAACVARSYDTSPRTEPNWQKAYMYCAFLLAGDGCLWFAAMIRHYEKCPTDMTKSVHVLCIPSDWRWSMVCSYDTSLRKVLKRQKAYSVFLVAGDDCPWCVACDPSLREETKKEEKEPDTHDSGDDCPWCVACDPSLQEETKRPNAPGDGRHCRLTPTIQAMIVCRARRARDARGADGASDPRRHQSPPGVTMSTRTVTVSETRVAFCRTAGKAMMLDVSAAIKN